MSAADEGEVGVGGNAEHLQDEVELLDVVTSWEERFATEELAKDAANGPDVDGGAVHLLADEKLGGTVPAGDDVLGLEAKFAIFAGEAEVADFEVAVGIEEEVGGLEVAMEHMGGVDILEATKGLVDEVLDVVVGELLGRLDDLVEVSVHELVHEVEVGKGGVGFGTHDVEEADEVLVAEVPQELHLAKGATGVDSIGERCGNLLDGDAVATLGVFGGNNYTIRALPYWLHGCVVLVHLEA